MFCSTSKVLRIALLSSQRFSLGRYRPMLSVGTVTCSASFTKAMA
jgi:hypothetical protein